MCACALRVRKCREKKRLLQGIDVQGKTDEEKARQLRVLLEAKEMKGALDSLRRSQAKGVHAAPFVS